MTRTAEQRQVRQQLSVDLTNLLFDPDLPQAAKNDVLRIVRWLAGAAEAEPGPTMLGPVLMAGPGVDAWKARKDQD
jgi:hypothetical protein